MPDDEEPAEEPDEPFADREELPELPDPELPEPEPVVVLAAPEVDDDESDEEDESDDEDDDVAADVEALVLRSAARLDFLLSARLSVR